ncbi:hypothetical protein [Roseivivax sp. CAU 1761]
MSQQLPIEPPRLQGAKPAFTIADPEAQTGLTDVIERGAIPSRYINRYHTDHDVRCAFCDNHTAHRRGFTAEMKDGRIALCGIDCGRKYFGMEVAKNFERALQKTEDEAKRDAILAAAMEDLPALHRQVREKWLPLEREVDEIMRALPRFGDSLLQRQITDGGDFVITDVHVEWMELPDGGRKPIETQIERGRIHGARILFMEAGRFWKVQSYCEAVIRGRDYLGRQIRDEQRLKYRMSITQGVEDGLLYLDTARKFLAPENLREFDKALRHYRGDGSQVQWKKKGQTPGVIRIRGSDYERVTIPLPALADLPKLDELAPPVRYKER